MIPKTIKKEHIIEAARSIDRNPVPEHRKAKKFEVTVNGRHYPPKYLISIASRMVRRPLKPDEFGGGVETNTFLSQLGFVVHRIADLAVVTGSRRRHRVKIARAWLDMGTSQAEFYPRWKKDKRDAFKKIIEKQFQNNKEKYYKRLWSLSSQAVQKKADILILPACALMFEKRLNYRKALGDNVPRIVASGKFQVRKRSRTDTALILRDWKPIRVPAHKVLWTGLDGEPFSIMAAISSTMVTRVREKKVKVSDHMKPDKDAPVLLLDMGHQRYTARYLYQSLRKVWESPRQSRRAVVVLSSWHYRAAHYECPWTWPLANEANFVRWEKGEPNDYGDVIDMIEVDLSQTRKPQPKSTN